MKPGLYANIHAKRIRIKHGSDSSKTASHVAQTARKIALSAIINKNLLKSRFNGFISSAFN